MTKEEALKQFAALGAAWFGNSKQHFAFSACPRCKQPKEKFNRA